MHAQKLADQKREAIGKRNGIVATILVHALLLLIFLLTGFRTPLPLPEEMGIAINFGTSNDGSGDIQPQENTAINNQQEAAPINNSSPPTEPTTITPVTQDVDEAPSVAPEKPKPKEPTPTKPDPKPDTKPTPEPPKPTVDNRALFPGRGKTDGGQTGEGETGKPGDQGDPNGDRDSRNHGQGRGTGDSGLPELNLTGRKFVQRPSINDNSQIEGRVVVEIVVDKNGRVLRARAGVRGSTITNANIIRKAEDAALKAQFNASSDAPEEQIGTISFIFKLN